MIIRLLDVNVLIGLLDSAHVHHAAAVRWFHKTACQEGWATCPITENGFIRIVSNLNYPNLRLTPGAAANSLARFRSGFAGIHHFWTDEVSLTDVTLFDLSQLAGSRQTTDAYLAGLAFRKRARLSTLDGGVAWKAVRGSNAALIERIPV
jgi:toxin-antitoxin system PIN domain toxin